MYNPTKSIQRLCEPQVPDMDGDGRPPHCNVVQDEANKSAVEKARIKANELLLHTYHIVKDLINEYLMSVNRKILPSLQTAEEFITNQDQPSPEVIEIFLTAMYREKFLSKLASKYEKCNDETLALPLLCFHLIIFELNQDTCEAILDSLYNWCPHRARKMLGYMVEEDNLLNLSKSCKSMRSYFLLALCLLLEVFFF